MDPAYRDAMAAFGRPLDPPPAAPPAAPSMPPPSAPEPIGFADPLALVLGLSLGALIGAAIGIGGMELSPPHLALPGVLTLALGVMLARPLHKVIAAAVASSVLCTIVGVPLSILRLLEGLW